MKTKKYIVNVFKYPEQVEVEAKSTSEARKLVSSKVSYSIWKTTIEYITEVV